MDMAKAQARIDRYRSDWPGCAAGRAPALKGQVLRGQARRASQSTGWRGRACAWFYHLQGLMLRSCSKALTASDEGRHYSKLCPGGLTADEGSRLIRSTRAVTSLIASVSAPRS